MDDPIDGGAISDLLSTTWIIAPRKTGGTGLAVSALDAAYVLQAVAGLRDLGPEGRLACDVTGNGTISTLDATRILQLIVQLIPRLPAAAACNTDWLFIPTPAVAPNQTVNNPLTAALPCRTGSIRFALLDTAVVNQDFRALVIGDCTGNWTPPAAALRAVAANRQAKVRMGRARRIPGGRIRVPIAINAQSVIALELQIELPAGARLESARSFGLSPGSMLQAAQHGQRVLIAVAASRAAEVNPTVVVTFGGASPDSAMTIQAAMVNDEPARIVQDFARQ